jgi:PleD family two-component response regulator
MRILVAEDHPRIASAVARGLRREGMAVDVAYDGDEGSEKVGVTRYDVVVLDRDLPGRSGDELCAEIVGDVTRVIMLTASGALRDKVEGLALGADDYLAKPFDARELLARVTALLRQAQRALDRNPTTGLPGGEAIQREIARRSAQDAPFAVVYLDLDDFKPFADRFGFAVADEAIREAGRAIAATAEGRADAFVGHVGGDDFVLICPAGEGRELARIARARFSQALPRQLPPEAVREGVYRAEDRFGVEREFALTRLSAAVVRVDPARWTTLERLGEVTAEAKLRAKAPGSGGVAEAEL